MVTSATIIEVREKRERIEALKTSRETCKLIKATPALSEVSGQAGGGRQ